MKIDVNETTSALFTGQFTATLALCRGSDRRRLVKCSGGKRCGRAEGAGPRTVCVCRLLIMGRACGSIYFIFMSQMVHVVLFMNKLGVENTSVSSAPCAKCTGTDKPNFHWKHRQFWHFFFRNGGGGVFPIRH